MNKRWTKVEINEAINMLTNEKLKFEEIASKLNRTTKSVRVKLNRIGYKEHKHIYWVIKKCECCGDEFKSLISENRKFCSQSCAATINNKKKPKKNKKVSFVNDNGKLNERKRKEYHNRKKKPCLNCGVFTTNKYCSHVCQQQFKWNEKKSLIENGDITLNVRHYKKFLIEKHGEKCMKCGWDEKHPVTGKVPIELEHKDGNSENNNINNLELLCPNCHSLTPTYRALNVGKGRHKRRERYKKGKSY
jgi:hypothetical protein